MYLEKIEVPAFRGLRDVVLEFGRVYDPQIFPLGSENGGGKSTLLQLVFTLLHCSGTKRRHVYLRNLLASHAFPADPAADESLVARLTVRIDEEPLALEFVSLHERFLTAKFEDDRPSLGFATTKELQRKIKKHRDASLASPIRSRLSKEVAALKSDKARIDALMVALNYYPISEYEPINSASPRGLICRAHGETSSKIAKILAQVSNQVFLLGPSNQQYLFLSTSARKLLVGAASVQDEEETEEDDEQEEKILRRPQIEYLSALEQAEKKMPGFYAYDWLSIVPLVELFEQAKNEDFKGVVMTGDYGSNYKALERHVNQLLVGKKIRPLPDLSGVEFVVVDERGEEISLGPEDLSQGELKRLMIFAWLRANNAVDALVLIDEIESSFHPDWQVGIVRDLQVWAPGNQYILATHSHEVCEALTPRHVRELEPRLRRGDASKSTSGHG